MAKKDKTQKIEIASGSFDLSKETDKFGSDLSSFLDKSCGLDIQTLNERDGVPYWIESGSYALNWVIGNSFFDGMPGTKTILISGNSATGKSLVTDVLLGKNIEKGGLSFKVDIEDAAGFKFAAKVMGGEDIARRVRLISPKTVAKKDASGNSKLDPAGLVITIERLTNILNKLIDYQISKGENKNPSILVVIDSVSQLSTDKEVTDVREENDKRDMSAQQKMRVLFRALTQMLRHANVTIVGIAHLTANIGGMAFAPKSVVNAKGTAFGYCSSLTLNAQSAKEIIDPKTKIPIGIRMCFKTTKNRCAFKGREAFLYLYFNRGIDAYGGLAELLTKYEIAKASAKANMDGSFNDTVKFVYVKNDGTEVKFTTHTVGHAIKENGGEELLKEMNQRLNDAYDQALAEAGTSEAELLEQDGVEETSGFEDIAIEEKEEE